MNIQFSERLAYPNKLGGHPPQDRCHKSIEETITAFEESGAGQGVGFVRNPETGFKASVTLPALGGPYEIKVVI